MSSVAALRTDAQGPWVALRETAFYPESGGQPADRGTLAGQPVRDVQSDPDGVVWHLVDQPVAGTVPGRIDWPRRFDHMQQHAAQHIASQAFLRVLGRDTVGFHIGESAATLDLAGRSAPKAEDLARVQALVDRILAENRPIRARFVDDGELARLALRRPPKVVGAVRVVEVEDFDRIPCGGTHPRTTAELGAVRLFPVAPEHGGFRIGYLAGGRAQRDYLERAGALDAIGRLLSLPPSEAPQAVADRLAELQRTRRALERWRRLALDAQVAELLREAAGHPLWRALPERDAADIRDLALRLAARGLPFAALVCPAGGGCHLAVCRAAGDGPHLGEAVAAFATALGGRGGGSPVAAQASLPQGPEIVLREFRDRAASLPTPG